MVRQCTFMCFGGAASEGGLRGVGRILSKSILLLLVSLVLSNLALSKASKAAPLELFTGEHEKNVVTGCLLKQPVTFDSFKNKKSDDWRHL